MEILILFLISQVDVHFHSVLPERTSSESEDESHYNNHVNTSFSLLIPVNQDKYLGVKNWDHF